jgi:hypothetical protein
MSATVNFTGATTIKAAVARAPLICHGYYLPVLENLYEKAQLYFSAKYDLEEFERHKAAGTFPSSMNSLKTPTIQVSHEFRQSEDAGAWTKIDDVTREARSKALAQAIACKRAEYKYYFKTWLSSESILTQLNNAGDKMADQLNAFNSVSKNDDLPEANKSDIRILLEVQADLARHVVELARSHALYNLERTKKKRKKIGQVDVQMSGMDTGAINEKTLEQTVQKVLLRKEQSRRDKKKNGPQKGNIPFAHFSSQQIANFFLLQRQEHGQGYQGNQDKEDQGPRKERQGFKRKIIEETAEILGQAPKRFRSGRVGDYPPVFFASRLESQVLFRLMKMSTTSIKTLRVMNFDVHKAPDVSLPRNIEYFLAVNMKYIFPQKMDLSLPRRSFESLENKLRQWSFFLGRERGERLPAYLAAADRRPNIYPRGRDFIEAGLAAGRDMVTALASSVIPFGTRDKEPLPCLSGMGVTIKSLRQYMLLNHLMAFITDKNLGIAVVTRTWYMTEVTAHLQLAVYERAEYIPWSAMYQYTKFICTQEALPKPIEKFLLESEIITDIPTFHGIPKIHKKPWAIRPIVPMHSYSTTRLAMVIHFYLHPLMPRYPWVCLSSRRFVRDLLRFSRGHPGTWKMMSGDVKSMYTNIQTDHLVNALRGAMRDAGFPKALNRFILLAVRHLNNNVFFQFDNQIYHQTYGIAMGLACSPSLANLFMAVWEERIGIPKYFYFYRRYIDDIFCIPHEYIDIEILVRIPGLELDWVSSDTIPFLDCEVHLHDQEICVRPYTKPLSHYQYIPWSSGHPLHVKRGFVLTELSRISSLSAKETYFDKKKEKFHEVLRARGYPEAALKSWFRKVKWRHPLSMKVARRSAFDEQTPLFVDAEYNPVWEQVRLGPVWDYFLGEIVRWHSCQVPPFSKAVNSLQRTRNFWDLIRGINKLSLQSDQPNSFEEMETDV